MARYRGLLQQRLLYLVPQLAASLNDSQHRHRQPRSTPRHSLQGPHIPGTKLGHVQQYLPALPPSFAALFNNIYHRRRKAHFATAPASISFSASISFLLPTQNGVR